MNSEIQITCRDIGVYITADMYGGERNEESLNRFQTFCKLWKTYGPFYWFASGGLSNNTGLSIAYCFEYDFLYNFPEAEPFLIGREENSADTWTQLENMAPLIKNFQLSQCKINGFMPQVFMVSDPWHLPNIILMCETLSLSVLPIPSAMSGGLIYRLKRSATEFARSQFMVKDPSFQSPRFKKMRQKRIEIARTMPR